MSHQLEHHAISDLEETGKEFGKGAYGVVIEMKSPDGTLVAAKKIHNIFFESGNEPTQAQSIKEQFKEECVRMSRLDHPNIVQFLGVYYEPGSDIPILIMERLPMSLAKYLEKEGTIPNHIKNSILEDVSLGLLFLHSKKPPIIHRDLTANNVLLTSDIKAKIGDLGVSRVFEPEAAKHYLRMSKCPGTQVYMPPEALKTNYKEIEDNFDKLDVFSFGVLILHVYTQKWPEPDDAVDEHNLPRTEIQRRQHLLDKVESTFLKQLAKQCLHNQPQSRPHTFDIACEIEKLVSSADKAIHRRKIEHCTEAYETIWKDAGLSQEHRKAMRSVSKSTDPDDKEQLFQDISSRLANGERRSLMEEITFLSQNKRSTLVRVRNNTPYVIETSCITIFGAQKESGVSEIPPKTEQGYNYKKSKLSFKGCAGIQTFAVKLSETSKLHFLVAFRNLTVQIKKKFHNKVALLFTEDSNINADLDVVIFERIMRNEDPNPDLPGCYPRGKYGCTFKATIASEQPTFEMTYDSIRIVVSMMPDYKSEVGVILLTNEGIALERSIERTPVITPTVPEERTTDDTPTKQVTSNSTPETTFNKKHCYIM